MQRSFQNSQLQAGMMQFIPDRRLGETHWAKQTEAPGCSPDLRNAAGGRCAARQCAAGVRAPNYAVSN